MDTALLLEMSQAFAKLSKDELVRHLVAGGTIYPTAAQLRRLPKDELVHMAALNAIPVPAWSGGAS